MGLLGTVYGLIGAFQQADMAGAGKGELLANGIYQSLVSTAAGLTIALPVLLLYQFFNTRIDRMTDKIDEGGNTFMRFYMQGDKAR